MEMASSIGSLDELRESGLDLERLPGNTAKIRLALDLAQPLRGRPRMRVLDVGCAGPQPLNLWEPLLPFSDRLDLVGVDVAGLDRVARRAGELGLALDLVEASAVDLSPVQGTFDAVVSTQVLEHIPDWRSAVREMARVVAPGGALYITCDSGEVGRGLAVSARLVGKRLLARAPGLARTTGLSGEWEAGPLLADLVAEAEAAGLEVQRAARYCLRDAKAAQGPAKGRSRALWLAFEETLAAESGPALDPQLWGILYLRAARPS
ncbi:MAG: hypothetical protein QOE36_665 [Gaiellaceae bacterium]|jgi:SAM-dependent methyltransferase|nr:hypothetical protein [Gaiellaceae bacterium]